MKKVLAAALLCAVSAFATWDYFPIKPAGKGEFKVGLGYDINAYDVDKLNTFGINAGVRFSVIEGLEIAAMLNFPLSASYDGTDVDDYAGMAAPIVGLRYWLPMGVGIFADITIPVDTRDDWEPALEIYPGVQYSTKITEELEFGGELGLVIPFENDNKYKDGMDLNIGVELDYSLGSLTPFVAADFQIGLTKPQYDGTDVGETAKLGIVPSVGVIFDINETFSVDASIAFGLGERYEETPMVINANFSVNF